MPKTYHGAVELTRKGGHIVEVMEGDARIRPLAPRLDLWNHSPSGFSWGYAGSGPAQLALALAADVLGDDARAVRIHQRLKFALLVRLPGDQPFVLTEAELVDRIRELEQEPRPPYSQL